MKDSKANGNGTQPNKTEISIAECILPEKADRRKCRRRLVKATGMDPKGMDCCHLCPNDTNHGGCMNPAHLYWGTRSQNQTDYWNSDRAQETRRKISEARKGKRSSETTRRKLSKLHKGKLVSEETKQKMRQAWERRRSKTM